MIKITKNEFNKLKSDSIDTISKSNGNYWIIQEKDGTFLPIKHVRGQYYRMKSFRKLHDILLWLGWNW